MKNISTSYTLFELNCGFYSQAFYKEDVGPRSKLKAINKLATKLRKLIAVCEKISSILKSFKSTIMINMQSLEAISLVTKCG